MFKLAKWSIVNSIQFRYRIRVSIEESDLFFANYKNKRGERAKILSFF